MRHNYIILITLSLLACTLAEEFYSDKYDYVNIDEILENDRLREQYYKCFMDTEPCITPDSIFFKEHISEAFATKCKKCTEIQKRNMDKMAEWYTTNQPDKWDALVESLLRNAKNSAN
ncbi:Ejaculatory bulb-specific protein 3 [Eufriesea mexicana]|uniref:Ejaculatory bulb-specific protein 3 n=1 Tax=Eufriesea mexicana TaxID=516756 RepID=A0A310SHC5_9HYME|nr:PREDICTED: ejaculatory bulb-specific protein 3-like [Eufriesea mexicana]OAD52842.1 Ejaculatory bulb-specific protein 3 [Eufriesea mexicana]